MRAADEIYFLFRFENKDIFLFKFFVDFDRQLFIRKINIKTDERKTPKVLTNNCRNYVKVTLKGEDIQNL